jgi:hypothetical protein
MWSVPRLHNESVECSELVRTPCGGGVEYLHRDPASRKRRRKGESQIWDSKIWLRFQRDSDSRKTTLASASSIHKSQTRPLVREDAHKNRAVIVRQINIWSQAPDGCFVSGQTGRLTVGRNIRLRLRLCELVKELRFSSCELLLLEAGGWGTGIVREPQGKGTSAVGSRYQTTTGEDTADSENLVRTVVNCRMCELVIVL